MSQFDPQPGDRIRFLKTLESGPNGEGPGNHYATKGHFGTIDRIGGCWERYWVFWDGWSSASFGAEHRIDFEILGESDLYKQPLLPGLEMKDTLNIGNK